MKHVLLAIFAIALVSGSMPRAVQADPPQVYMSVTNATGYTVALVLNSPTTRGWAKTTIKPGDVYRCPFSGTFELTGDVKIGTTNVSLVPKTVTINDYHKISVTIGYDAQGKYFFK